MTDGRYDKSPAVRAGALTIAALLVAGCAGNALETGGTEASAQDLLGDPLVVMGLKADPNQEFIEYNPRSPLVMPSDSSLPAPTQQAALGPEWPDDPDVRAARQIEEMRRAASQQGVEEVENASRAMSRSELEEWGRRYGRVDTNQRQATRTRREPDNLWSREQLARGEVDPNAPIPVPQRSALTEPPTQYRVPAEGAEGYTPSEPKKKGWFARMMGF